MKRSLIATLFLVVMIAVASGSRAAPPAATPEAPQFGGCRWFCITTGKAFTTASACATACGGPANCDEVC